MGIGASVVKRRKSLGLWSEQEKLAILHAEQTLRRAAAFAAEHFYYNVPIVITRASIDPLSVMWMKADATAFQDITERNAGRVLSRLDGRALLRAVPTVVMFTPEGLLTIVFEYSKVSYDILMHDILRALDVFDIPSPSPPYLITATSSVLTLQWDPPYPPGITQLLEVQYAYAKQPFVWSALVSKSYEMPAFTTICTHALPANTSLVFRLRCRTYAGWSEYSEPSSIYTTLATAPDTPAAPKSQAILPNAIHLHWTAPNDNGSAIIEYMLEGRSVGGDFTTLYSGPLTHKLVFGLQPEFAYSFRIACRNSVGVSNYSALFSVQTPARIAIADGALNPSYMPLSCLQSALSCSDAWQRHYEPSEGSEREFYFNLLTGSRQRSEPTAWHCSEQPVDMTEATFRHSRQCFRKALRAHFKLAAALDNRTPLPVILPDIDTFAPQISDEAVAVASSPNQRIQLQIRRSHLLLDGMQQLLPVRCDILRKQKIRVVFTGEAGLDAGGLTKEFLVLFADQLMKYCTVYRHCFCVLPTGDYYFAQAAACKDIVDSPEMILDVETHIALSEVPTEQLLQLFGRLVGKCLYDDYQIPAPFTSILAKHLLVSAADCRNITSLPHAIFTLEDISLIDNELFRSLQWLLQNDVSDLGMTFTVTQNNEDVNLCKDGADKIVTDQNKLEFVRLKILWHVVYSVHTNLFPFMKGYRDMIPLVISEKQTFTPMQFLELLTGPQTIIVETLRAYTIFRGSVGWGENHVTILNLWQWLRESEENVKRQFLQFVTGCISIPLDGFKPPFCITEGSDMKMDSLPRAHTCFNQLVLPHYSSMSTLRHAMELAITEAGTFDLA